MRRFCLFLLMSCAAGTLSAQLRNADVYKNPEAFGANLRVSLRVPDILGYKTLKCDFHIHTLFSDGQVWPSLRVDEAWRDGLDAIAITDHIEVRPHKGELTGDLNRSYQIAKARGERCGMIVIHGTEITRSKPFGHMNALFIQDANPLDTPDQMEALNAALAQRAFIMWNHPGWPNDTSTLYALHERLLKEGKINGIEIINGCEWYPRVADWCRAYGVSYLGNSDIHGLTELYYGVGWRRPMNLVFASDRSEEGIREALFAGRSVTCFNHTYFGPERYLKALAQASLRFTLLFTDAKGRRSYQVENDSDLAFRIAWGENTLYVVGPGEIRRIDLPAEPVEARIENFLSGEQLPVHVTLPFVAQ